MMRSDANIYNRLRDVTVLIVGDVMLDQYWWGTVNRISPEAPVPVVRLEKMTFAPGGAANVAANVAGLGARPVLLSCIGRDSEADALKAHLTELGISVEHLHSVDRPTPTKTRIVAHGQHVVRVDREDPSAMSIEGMAQFKNDLSDLTAGADVVIISDYAKGMITTELLGTCIATARNNGIRVLVDPKGRDYSKYKGAAMITPNRREAAEACGLDETAIDATNAAGKLLLDNLNMEAVIITEGEEGMTVFERGQRPVAMQAETHEVYDVTGAGDTVIATLAVGLAAGMPLVDAVRFSNVAASIVVEHVGTTAISLDRLVEKLEASTDANSVVV